jgi:hypothetical protein
MLPGTGVPAVLRIRIPTDPHSFWEYGSGSRRAKITQFLRDLDEEHNVARYRGTSSVADPDPHESALILGIRIRIQEGQNYQFLRDLDEEHNVARYHSVPGSGSAFILVRWIRIRIGNTDPEPGGPKLPTKVKKIQVLKCQKLFSFES